MRLDPSEVFQRLAKTEQDVFWLDGGNERSSLLGVGRPANITKNTIASLRRAYHEAGTSGSIALIGWLDYSLASDTLGLQVRSLEGEKSRFLQATNALRINPDGAVSLLGSPEMPDATLLLEAVQSTRSDPGETRSRQAVDPALTRQQELHWSDDADAFLDHVLAIQHSIGEGDAYVVCLTTRVESSSSIDPLTVYETLRERHGTSRCGIIRLGDQWLISISPEHFLTIDHDRTVTTRPIKGTRPRSQDPALDSSLRSNLEASEKEHAENLMIVDLMRNDLSRVCETGTVGVTNLFAIETLPSVHQLVSTVSGRLRTDLDVFDAIEACFPAGSMTGAPKRKAVEILEQLETSPRGIYSGAFGYIACDGTADLSMTIRSIVYGPKGWSVGTGGGITSMSIPDDEVAEYRLKAKALIDAATE